MHCAAPLLIAAHHAQFVNTSFYGGAKTDQKSSGRKVGTPFGLDSRSARSAGG
jgi:hypothetical protein